MDVRMQKHLTTMLVEVGTGAKESYSLILALGSHIPQSCLKRKMGTAYLRAVFGRDSVLASKEIQCKRIGLRPRGFPVGFPVGFVFEGRPQRLTSSILKKSFFVFLFSCFSSSLFASTCFVSHLFPSLGCVSDPQTFCKESAVLFCSPSYGNCSYADTFVYFNGAAPTAANIGMDAGDCVFTVVKSAGGSTYVNYGFTKLYIGVAPDLYTITLSGGTEVEPWNAITDVDHKKATLKYTAIVMDASKQPAQPAPNVEVTITTEVDEYSGGHIHNTDRPKGKLAIPSDPIKDGKEKITGKTDINGVYSFVFGAEEASGTHTLTAKCTGCQAPATAPVNVKVDGLQPIPAVPLFYALVEANGDVIGAKPGWHTDNHNLTHAAAQQLMIIAALYRSPKFMLILDKKTGRKDFPPPLHINDASLPWGGVYDICARPNACSDGVIAWHKPHGEHRRGTVIDVRSNGEVGSIPASNKAKFKDFLMRRGLPYLHEDPGLANEHFHIRLMKKKE